MQFAEKIPKVAFYIIVGCLYVYAFATGIAITHSDYVDECPTCALAKNATNQKLGKLLKKQQT